MERGKLFFKWILPIGTVLAGFFCIGSIIDSRLELNDLVKVNGSISDVKHFRSYSRYSSNDNLLLKLDDGKTYKLGYEWHDKFPLVEKLKMEDLPVELYHRKQSQTIWRFGTTDIIYQLKIGATMILSIDERHKKSLNVVGINALFCFIGVIAMFYRKQYVNKIQ
jgi:hypothetical protein